MDTYMTTVISNEKIADKIFRMELQGDIVQEMTTPGQFVNIKVNNSYEFLLRRPISICEINHEKKSFVIVYRADGAGTKIISELKEGEIVGVFPEGTRSHSKELDLGQSHNGASFIATRAKTKIIPFAIIPNKNFRLFFIHNYYSNIFNTHNSLLF